LTGLGDLSQKKKTEGLKLERNKEWTGQKEKWKEAVSMCEMVVLRRAGKKGVPSEGACRRGK